jgi:hypothetical protein
MSANRMLSGERQNGEEGIGDKRGRNGEREGEGETETEIKAVTDRMTEGERRDAKRERKSQDVAVSLL